MKLEDFYEKGGDERIGVILHDDSLIEVSNTYTDPKYGASIAAADLFRFEDKIKAFWHTHPGRSSDPSREDIIAFKNYPKLFHYIIGEDGVKCYAVIGGDVVQCG